MNHIRKVAMGGAVILCQLLALPVAHAALVGLTMQLRGPDGPLLVNSISTPLPSGLTFHIVVDDATFDTWADADFGLFPVVSVRMTSADLGIFNELVTTPLAYFEDVSPEERAGLSPLFPNAGLQVSLAAAGQSQIGNPNLIDTVPELIGVPSFSGWSENFEITLANGTTISNQGNYVRFAESSLAAAVPEPGTLALLSLAIAGLAALRRRRQ